MIVIDNIKYACQKCIQGHRSSRCDHTDRKLVIVRRKGRPISQCDECRKQRKTRQIHQKCVCTTLTSKKEFKKYSLSNNSSSFKSINTTRQIMSIDALLL
ncbi:unnamed protein product [Mucor hiemalis]